MALLEDLSAGESLFKPQNTKLSSQLDPTKWERATIHNFNFSLFLLPQFLRPPPSPPTLEESQMNDESKNEKCKPKPTQGRRIRSKNGKGKWRAHKKSEKTICLIKRASFELKFSNNFPSFWHKSRWFYDIRSLQLDSSRQQRTKYTDIHVKCAGKQETSRAASPRLTEVLPTRPPFHSSSYWRNSSYLCFTTIISQEQW